jgi:hypothetical protein
LAQGVIQAMFIQTVKVCGIAAVLTIGVVGTLVVAQQEKTQVLEGPTYLAPPGGLKRSAVTQEEVQKAEQELKKAEQEQKAEQELKKAEQQLRRAEEAILTAKILRKLDEQIDLKLPNPTQLTDFLKAVKQATTDNKFSGIPIYVDPVGLDDAGAKIESHLTAYNNGPLKSVLRESLRPLKLSFIVKDGFLMISSRDDITQRRLEDLDQKVDRLLNAMEQMNHQMVGSNRR